MLIEQRLLPHEFKVVATRDFKETARAITDMVVRGAGAIGATAAYGLAQGALAFEGRNAAAFKRHIDQVYATLKKARPTAVDPVNAMDQVRAVMQGSWVENGRTRIGSKPPKNGELPIEEQQALALAAAEEFAQEDVQHCTEIGKHGAGLIRQGMRILTHCNAGWLAFLQDTHQIAECVARVNNILD